MISSIEQAEIDVTAACGQQYGSAAYAVTENSSDPYSWQCRRDFGGVNLNQYCQGIGYEEAALTGNTAYDWRCRTAG